MNGEAGASNLTSVSIASANSGVRQELPRKRSPRAFANSISAATIVLNRKRSRSRVTRATVLCRKRRIASSDVS